MIPELPDATKSVLTLGAGYNITDKFSVDLSFMYDNFAERSDVNKESQFSGSYKTFVTVIGLGVNYTF